MPAPLGADWDLLPATSAWAVPVADTRSPLTTVSLLADDGLAIDVGLAADFPLVRWSPGETELTLGLAAGTWMRFGAGGELTFDLLTFDGLFALPLDLRSGRWAGRLQWAHVSAHWGDGVRKADEKPTNLDPWSREYLQVQGGPRLGPVRLYAGARALVHSLPGAPPLAFQAGGEVWGRWTTAPYLAADVQFAQEFGWAPALAGQLGVSWARGPSRLRVALAGRVGPEDTGKLAGAREATLGLLVGFDRCGP